MGDRDGHPDRPTPATLLEPTRTQFLRFTGLGSGPNIGSANIAFADDARSALRDLTRHLTGEERRNVGEIAQAFDDFS